MMSEEEKRIAEEEIREERNNEYYEQDRGLDDFKLSNLYQLMKEYCLEIDSDGFNEYVREQYKEYLNKGV